MLWPRVGDAWGAVNARLHCRRRGMTRRAVAGRSAQELRRDADHPRRLARRRRGRAARDHRPERRRQIDAVPPHQRPHQAELGRGASARRAHHRADAVRDQSPRPVAQLPDHQHLSRDCRSRKTCAAPSLWSLGYKYAFWTVVDRLRDVRERTEWLMERIGLTARRACRRRAS